MYIHPLRCLWLASSPPRELSHAVSLPRSFHRDSLSSSYWATRLWPWSSVGLNPSVAKLSASRSSLPVFHWLSCSDPRHSRSATLLASSPHPQSCLDPCSLMRQLGASTVLAQHASSREPVLTSLEWLRSRSTTLVAQFSARLKPQSKDIVSLGGIDVSSTLELQDGSMSPLSWLRLARSMPAPVLSSQFTEDAATSGTHKEQWLAAPEWGRAHRARSLLSSSVSRSPSSPPSMPWHPRGQLDRGQRARRLIPWSPGFRKFSPVKNQWSFGGRVLQAQTQLAQHGVLRWEMRREQTGQTYHSAKTHLLRLPLMCFWTCSRTEMMEDYVDGLGSWAHGQVDKPKGLQGEVTRESGGNRERPGRHDAPGRIAGGSAARTRVERRKRTQRRGTWDWGQRVCDLFLRPRTSSFAPSGFKFWRKRRRPSAATGNRRHISCNGISWRARSFTNSIS